MIPVPGAPVIFWCNICQAAPADGKLEILEEDEIETRMIDACTSCVEKLEDDEWL